MSVPYERYDDDIEAVDQSSFSSEEGQSSPAARPDVVILPHKRRYQEVFRDRWPLHMGIAQLVLGTITGMLGIVNVIILPLVLDLDSDALHTVKLNESNLWGIALWAGLILIVTGSLGMRAAIYKSVSTVYVFFGFILLDIIIFFAFIVIILVGYSNGWTVPAVYKDKQSFFYTHLAVSILIPIGSFNLTVAFTQYYEDVFCGELQCLRRALHCCLPCWCPRVVEPEELMSEQGRPPNLLI